MLAFLAAALAASLQPTAPEAPAPETAAPEAAAPETAAPEAAPAQPTVLESAVPWWEKITVTVDDKGKQQSCLYETSSSAGRKEACDEGIAASLPSGKSSGDGLYSKLTFERRFSTGGRLDSGQLQPGDTLLGRQVMFLTFDAEGAIEACHVVATSGEAPTDYDCDEVRKEQFKALASDDPGARQAFMTVLAYGHTEQIA